MFTYVSLAEAPRGPSLACARLPEIPAVYAIFRAAQLVPTGVVETFCEQVTSLVEAPAAIEHESRVGPLHHVRLRAQSRLSARKEALLGRLASDLAFQGYLSDVLRKASLLQAPLYVGKATNLRQRILQHLDPSSDLSTRLRQQGLSIERTTVAYVEVALDPSALDLDALELVEELLTRLCRPGFVSRIG